MNTRKNNKNLIFYPFSKTKINQSTTVENKHRLYKTTYKGNINQESLKQTTLLLSDFKFNSQTIFYNMKLSQFISKTHYGLNHNTVLNIEKRTEMNKHYGFDNYNIDR